MTKSDPRALRSRQAIIAAAVRLLRRGGVEAVTHQSVAVEAGVGRATVYRHWPRLIDLLLDSLADSTPVVDFGAGDLRTQLIHEFSQRLPDINSPVAMAVVGMLVGRADHDPEVHELRDRIFGKLIITISSVFTAAVEDGQLVPDAPADELATIILGTLLFRRSLLGCDITVSYLEHVVDATLRGWFQDPAADPARPADARVDVI